MKFSDIIDAVKAFFLDILGFLIPGLFALLILSSTIKPEYKFNVKKVGIEQSWSEALTLLMAYVLGYVIYSLPLLTDPVFRKIKYLHFEDTDAIERGIENSHEFEVTKNVLKELLILKNSSPAYDDTKLLSMKARPIRNIVLSYITESETKIYTFMFRAELSKNIGAFAFLYGCIGLLMSTVSHFTHWNLIFRADIQNFATHILLILSSFLLLKTRERFASIAYRIPFSIFLAKYFAIK